jgi:threonine dehydratase
VKVIAVEPEDSCCLKAALDAGEPVVLDQVSMFADGVAVKRIGDETFRVCKEYLDGHITVTSDEICSAVKDIFEDTRAIAEPSGALALAGLKKYAEREQLKDKQLGTVLSGANTNFHGLRYVSERCELGEKREGLLAVTIPERKGAFFEFCDLIGGRAVTEFNYRYNSDELANIFVGVRLQNGQAELDNIIHDLRAGGYPVVDLSDDEMAKLHVRYMIGGKPSKPLQERLYSFEFPEYPGALIKFLSTLGTHWNISLFNYRNHGADYGRVLCGFELADSDLDRFSAHLRELGYQCKDVTDDTAYQFFLR